MPSTAIAPEQSSHGIDDFAETDPLILPAAWTAPPRPPIPIVASTVPLIGAVVLWLVTGSMLALLLAGLGPLIAVATVLDGARGARRDRRRATAAAAAARLRVEGAIVLRHDAERRRRWVRHPDVASFIARDGEVWRSMPGRGDALVIGAGTQRAACACRGVRTIRMPLRCALARRG